MCPTSASHSLGQKVLRMLHFLTKRGFGTTMAPPLSPHRFCRGGGGGGRGKGGVFVAARALKSFIS